MVAGSSAAGIDRRPARDPGIDAFAEIAGRHDAANCSLSTCSPSPIVMFTPRVTAAMIAPTASGECRG